MRSDGGPSTCIWFNDSLALKVKGREGERQREGGAEGLDGRRGGKRGRGQTEGKEEREGKGRRREEGGGRRAEEEAWSETGGERVTRIGDLEFDKYVA